MLKRAATIGRRALPSRAFRVLRSLGTASLTPFRFSFVRGHALSSLRERALDRHGQPLPWLTYPAIDALAASPLSGLRVLEFGSGQSTLWFATRAQSVVSFEHDAQWQAYVARSAPANVQLHLLPKSLEGIEAVLAPDERFQLVLVDGMDRTVAAAHARDFVAPNGVVVVDNSDANSGPPRPHPIMDLFRDAGFMRVDYYGQCPGIMYPHCTSMFFKPGCFMFTGAGAPRPFADFESQR